MIPLTPGERALLQRTNEAAMQDECVHSIRSTAEDSAGQDVPSYADGATYACGFDPTGGQEVTQHLAGHSQTQQQTIVTDARVRLPLAAKDLISPLDQIRLTKRFGVALSVPRTFDVIGSPQVGPSGVLLMLKKVEIGS